MAASNSSPNTMGDEYDASLGYHPSIPPLDIRLGLTNPPSSTTQPTTLRWGILGCSKVAHDFTQALKYLYTKCHLPHSISAVGSRSIIRSMEFAKLHNVSNAHGSYEELCADPSVDIIYVASLHPYHREHAEMALKSGRNVLVEKPMTMNSNDAQYLYDLGRELNLFVGEGMWTRFFPAVEWTRCHFGGENDTKNAGIDPLRPPTRPIGQS